MDRVSGSYLVVRAREAVVVAVVNLPFMADDRKEFILIQPVWSKVPRR